ncbi:MAG TPA: tRNA (adenosine(37)-N6)-threonylcarbamoyltransferase complex dimerization subunit type 1 TsaB [Deltaproteobacteria bacterium]|nr:tRNA (adenosine(37)-N6)-threonylcarbamoyltransferase complex dimerization subunit type 1 TsaB [Deltaproteobacteria bacterium]HOM30278.1 tRNA (adenosine(37)-N6)-threonylcarbamoyltransferase complex dimerization subunit type 1 TsaB [Deltaproteobacteria bacterium]HPP80623.1 tRNA (adenosine(37)-N6)-threonylcarbamoyltransferase complex dimerization subunit type 1 TsaB [Deltaproteobacteria bacterium]
MKVLGLDTSTTHISVAVCIDGDTACEIGFETGSGHAGIILSVVDEVLRRSGTRKEDLEMIAVGLGPGSFTGLRIGIATAKGLAASLGCAVAGVLSLDALAFGALPSPLPVVTVVDARKGEVFCAVYDTHGTRLMGPANVTPEEAARLAEGPALFVGNACAPYRGIFSGALGDLYVEAPGHLRHPRASVVAALGVKAASSGSGLEIMPVYVRESDAALSLQRRSAKPRGAPRG